ncbi:MAG TPA: DUF4388 domain-containing protein [Acidimicrobiia bacterium]|nr:DUF4388 domain-containing protein [Acidimicrobiia bacterium]
MHLSGQLSDWSINDLLQIMQVTSKTGSLDIEGQRRGRVHFREGRLTGAELTGENGSYAGSDRSAIADILYVLSTVEEGSFSVGAADGPESKGWTIEEVLLDVVALQSLEGEVVDAGLFEASGVALVNQIQQPITIEPEDWHVFTNLVPPFTFNYLESRYGRGAAVRVFHTLHRLGMAETVADLDGEAVWLDRLAEGVAPGTPQPAWAGNGDSAESTEAPPETEPEEEAEDEPVVAAKPDRIQANMKGLSAPANTTLTDGVYDEIRRLRSRVGEK